MAESVAVMANGDADLAPHNHAFAESGEDFSSDQAATKQARDAERRRRRRKLKKKLNSKAAGAAEDGNDKEGDEDKEEQVEIEYVSEKPEFADSDGHLNPLIEDFVRVFEKFANAEELFPVSNKDDASKEDDEAKKKANSDNLSDDDDDFIIGKDNGNSNKKKKAQRRMKIAELKQQCLKPDVVEVWDATAADPRLLVFLKTYRNTVPVPRHWCQKRKFLQGKRGVEKQPFQLPDFIAATGIEKIRQAYIEKADSKKLKQKQREKVQPKMGTMDMNYQVLYDSFFKFQTKPNLTSHGDLYHEGKEFEVKLRKMKPGHLSQKVKDSLGMPEGAPPPWLINMQRYGPPPYPHLKIPGLNAPIPEGASFGYHPGGWGKAPVDEYGRPLYGNVFGVQHQEADHYEEEPIDRFQHWGDLEEAEEEQEDEEEIDEDAVEVALDDGITSVDSISTTPTGVEAPGVIDLRKAQRKQPEKQLYKVLEEREERIQPGQLLGTSHTYMLPTGGEKAAAKKVDLLKSQRTDKVDITLRPEELEGLDEVALAAKYEEASQEAVLTQREDYSVMVAEVEKERKRKQQAKEGKTKKQKDFKF